MRVVICGVRGSTPSSGDRFLRHGGRTSCVALCHDGGAPTLLLDAGTGLRQVDELLGGRAFSGSILLSHLHWDHVQGLPFFSSGDRPDARVDLYLPAQGQAEAVLSRVMSPPFFPITPDELRGTWQFHSLEAGVHHIEGFTVLALEVPHKGGRTYGFRISDSRSSMTYMSDHGPAGLGPGLDGLGEYHDAALKLASNTDLLIHDAQHADDELSDKTYLGHSAGGYAVQLAAKTGAKRVVLFHHDPMRTDDQLDELAARYQRQSSVPVDAAAEGMEFELPET